MRTPLNIVIPNPAICAALALSGTEQKPAGREELASVIAEFEQRREDIRSAQLEKLFDKRETFKTMYVPYMVAELVWDYADTLVDLCKNIRISGARHLCRKVERLRRQYLENHARFFDDAHINGERTNSLVFEESVADLFSVLTANVRAVVKSAYPDLFPEYVDLLVAECQCEVLLTALTRFWLKMGDKVSRRTGRAVTTLIPEELKQLDSLLPKFMGNCPIPKSFIPVKREFITALSVRMALVEP